MRTLVIIPYVPPAYGAVDSIDVALRSIKKYFEEETEVVVVGKRPDHVSGDEDGIIWGDMSFHRGEDPHTDMVRRILWALDTYGQDRDGFVLWHDDMIAVNPFTLEDVKEPLALSGPILSSKDSSNYFLADMHWTLQELREEKLVPINYTMHCPRWYDTLTFRELVQRFDLTARGLDFEMLYFNENFRSPKVLNRENNHYVILMSNIYRPPLDLPFWIGLTNDFNNNQFFQAVKERVNQ